MQSQLLIEPLATNANIKRRLRIIPIRMHKDF